MTQEMFLQLKEMINYKIDDLRIMLNDNGYDNDYVNEYGFNLKEDLEKELSLTYDFLNNFIELFDNERNENCITK